MELILKLTFLFILIRLQVLRQHVEIEQLYGYYQTNTNNSNWRYPKSFMGWANEIHQKVFNMKIKHFLLTKAWQLHSTFQLITLPLFKYYISN